MNVDAQTMCTFLKGYILNFPNIYSNFQKLLGIKTFKNETLCIDRRAHLLWENPNLESKIIIDDLIESWTESGEPIRSFLQQRIVNSFLEMFKISWRIEKVKDDVRVYANVVSQNIGQISHEQLLAVKQESIIL